MVRILMKQLQHMKYVCTAADIWSTNIRSYLGMSAHCPERNVQQSRALALGLIKESHTFDYVARLTCSIPKQFAA